MGKLVIELKFMTERGSEIFAVDFSRCRVPHDCLLRLTLIIHIILRLPFLW